MCTLYIIYIYIQHSCSGEYTSHVVYTIRCCAVPQRFMRYLVNVVDHRTTLYYIVQIVLVFHEHVIGRTYVINAPEHLK